MRPRLIAVDDARLEGVHAQDESASMRPRLIAVDDALNRQINRRARAAASMRPRLIAVDDASALAEQGGRDEALQ